MTKDEAARERALDPSRSFIVQAPAGSGKTELLIQRHLRLLAAVDRPEAVVAITFTRKAAGEMRRRVLAALESAAGPRPEKPHEARTWELARAVRERDRALGWNLAQCPHRLEMRTIDSLCYALVSRMPWLSRLGAAPEIVEDAADLYREAARRTIGLLETAEWAWAMERLLARTDNDVPTLQELIAAMLAKRDQWLRHTGAGGADPAAVRSALEAALANVIRDALADVARCLPRGTARELARLGLIAAGNLARLGRENGISACGELAGAPGTEPEDAPYWQGFAEMLLTGSGDWRKAITVAIGFPPDARAHKAALQSVLESVRENEELRARLGGLRCLPPPEFDEQQWAVVEAMLALLPAAAAQLEMVFRERRTVDFAGAMLAALRALGTPGEPADLALALDGRIEHLLVDEFQDTSRSQFDLLERLTAGWEPGDGRTLFVVGDPMQSIYRFREAEVGLFLKAVRDGIGQARLEPLRLEMNFRSDPGIVEWANGAFPSVFPRAEEIATGAVPFSASRAARTGGGDVPVRVHALLNRSDAEEARQVAEIVREAKERDDKQRIAVLVRARTHVVSILRALREAGLRYRAVEIDRLADAPAIQDLLALTFALLHPADRVSWLAVLRAPWCGLTLADLHALAAGDRFGAVWDLISGDAALARVAPESRERLARVRDVLARTLGGRDGGLRAWIEGTWLALGGPACVSGAADLENARAFFDLLEEVDRGRDADLDLLARRVADLFARPDPGAGDSLQVMTIHKAKGLEFDVVIVPGLGRKTRAEEAKLLMWLERPSRSSEGELLVAPVKEAGAESDRLLEYVKSVEKEKAAHEDGRLLYVAATRARWELHLLGHVGWSAEDGLKKPEAASLLSRIWTVVEPAFLARAAELESSGTVPNAGEEEPGPPAQPLRRLAAGWKLPEPPAPVAAVPAAEETGMSRERVSFEWVGDTLRHVGTVVHATLQRIGENGLEAREREAAGARRSVYEAALRSLGVSEDELPSAAARVERAVARTLADGRGRWILGGAHEDARSEYALTGFIAGEFVSARIDRTFVDEHGARWIVDFKTSAHEGGGLGQFLANELERWRGPMQKYRTLFALREARPIRMGLYFPLLGAWCEYEETAAGMSRE